MNERQLQIVSDYKLQRQQIVIRTNIDMMAKKIDTHTPNGQQEVGDPTLFVYFALEAQILRIGSFNSSQCFYNYDLIHL